MHLSEKDDSVDSELESLDYSHIQKKQNTLIVDQKSLMFSSRTKHGLKKASAVTPEIVLIEFIDLSFLFIRLKHLQRTVALFP